MLCLSGFKLYSRWVPLPYFSAILLSLKSMERSLTKRNFLVSKQMIFLLKMSVNRNGEKLTASNRQAKISTVNRILTSR